MNRKDKYWIYKRNMVGEIKAISDSDISIYMGSFSDEALNNNGVKVCQSIVSFCDVCQHNTLHYLVYDKVDGRYIPRRFDGGFVFECQGCVDRIQYGPGYDELKDEILRLNGWIE